MDGTHYDACSVTGLEESNSYDTFIIATEQSLT
jgi:hypothetical protein